MGECFLFVCSKNCFDVVGYFLFDCSGLLDSGFLIILDDRIMRINGCGYVVVVEDVRVKVLVFWENI